MNLSQLPVDASIYTVPKVDCHCHVLNPEGFAYAADVAYSPVGQETGSADYFSTVLAAYGVRHALLVGPNSGYGTDNRCLLSAIAGSQGRFKGIAVVPNDASALYLQELKAQGIVGVAFAPGKKMIVATASALYRLHAGVDGASLPPGV